jgi:hypothetical protein
LPGSNCFANHGNAVRQCMAVVLLMVHHPSDRELRPLALGRNGCAHWPEQLRLFQRAAKRRFDGARTRSAALPDTADFDDFKAYNDSTGTRPPTSHCAGLRRHPTRCG